MIFIVKESTITEERGRLFRELIIELLGYARDIDIKIFLSTVTVLITHCY